MTGVFIIGLFAVLMAVGVPVAGALGLSALIYMAVMTSIDPILVVQQMINGSDKFTLLAIPFFIMAGGFMERGGISSRIVQFAKSVFSPLPGGLALVVIGSSMIFASMTGAGAATAAAIGSIMLPAMRREKYDDDFGCALQASAGIFGPLIPPSILMVLYGVATNTSVGDMLLSGVFPGLFLGVVMAGVTISLCLKNGYRGEGRLSFREIASSFVHAFFALLTPVIILGGIYTGIFTATEAAAVAALYSLIAGGLIYRELTWAKILDIAFKSCKLAAGILFIVAATQAFGWVLTRERIPQLVGEFFSNISSNPVIFLFAVSILLLIAGCFLDPVPAIMIFTPILAPPAMKYGINPIHFGVVMVVALCIGLITPPVGMNLFVVSSLSKRPIHAIVPKLWPFIISMIAGLVAVILFPGLSLWLPEKLG
ncbi:MAG: TRAP transporter large permease subunit [Planctomycetota bacterium]|jgi:C4-dicarboxylate transporter DctM subunit|nr:TRAP transporter large permease subunit [Planctomycetota bacterium]